MQQKRETLNLEKKGGSCVFPAPARDVSGSPLDLPEVHHHSYKYECTMYHGLCGGK